MTIKYPSIVKVITFNKIEDFFDQIIHYKSSSKIDLSGYIFRGHSSEKYQLIPTSLRPENRVKVFEMAKRSIQDDSDMELSFTEDLLLRKFYEKADLQSLGVPSIKVFEKDNKVKSEDIINPLPVSRHKLAALAQHYGCPTRLLDWSNDINTALYFAITGIKKEELNKDNDFFDIWCLSESRIGNLNHSRTKEKGTLLIFRPQYKGNPNLAAQKGVFSLWNPNDLGGSTDPGSVDRRSLDEILHEKLVKEEILEYYEKGKPMLYLFKIPKIFSSEIYKYLSSINWTGSRLFPGYKGITKEIFEDSLFLSQNEKS